MLGNTTRPYPPINACLDLDKHEAQIVDEPREDTGAAEMPTGPALPASTRRRTFGPTAAAS